MDGHNKYQQIRLMSQSPAWYSSNVGIYDNWQTQSLTAQLHESEAQRSMLSQQVAELQAQKHSYEHQFKELQYIQQTREQEQHKQIITLQSQKEEMNRWIEVKKREYDQYAMNMNSQTEQLKGQAASYQNQLNVQVQRYHQLEQETQSMIAQYNFKEKEYIYQIKELETMVAQLKIKDQEANRVLVTLNGSKEEMARWIEVRQREYDTKIANLTSQLEQYRAQLNQANSDLSILNQRYQQFEQQATGQIGLLTQKEKDLINQVAHLEAGITKFQVKDQDANRAITTLSGTKEDMTRWIDQKTREYETRIMALSTQFEQARANAEYTSRELASQVQRYQKLEQETTVLITQLSAKDKDAIHQLQELKTMLSISQSKEQDQGKSLQVLQRTKDELSTQLEVRTREYENRVVSLTSQLEAVKAKAETYSNELALQLQRYQILEQDTTKIIYQLQTSDKEHVQQATSLEQMVHKLQDENHRMESLMKQRVFELEKNVEQKEDIELQTGGKINDQLLEIDRLRRLEEDLRSRLEAAESKMVDWQNRYWGLVDQSRAEVMRLGQLFKTDSEEAERRYGIRLRQLEEAWRLEKVQLNAEHERKVNALRQLEQQCEEERNQLRQTVSKLQDTNRSLEQQYREFRVVGQAKEQESSGAIISLQSTKEELIRTIEIRQAEYESRLLNVGSQLEHVKAQGQSCAKELQLQIQRYQSLETESSYKLTQMLAKEREHVNRIAELDDLATRLQAENQRLDSLIKSMMIELQILSDKKEDLRIIDEFQLNEKDLELARLRRLEVEQRTRIEVLEKQFSALQLDSDKEIHRLRSMLIGQKNDLELLHTKIHQLDDHKQVEQHHLTTISVDHENELNLWRSRYYNLESENGRLTAQLKILLNEIDVVWIKLEEVGQDKTGRLQRELENMRGQFDLLSKNYLRIQKEKSLNDLKSSKQVTSSKDLLIIKEEYELVITQLRKELALAQSQIGALEDKLADQSRQPSLNLPNEDFSLKLRLSQEDYKRILEENERLSSSIEEKQTIVFGLERRVTEQRDTIEALQSQIILMSSGIEELKLKAQRDQERLLQKQSLFTESHLSEVQMQLKDLYQHNTQLEQNLRTLQQANNNYENLLKQRDEGSENQLLSYETKVSEQQRHIHQLELQINAVERERDRLHSEQHVLQRESLVHQQQLSQIEQLKQLLSQQQREHNAQQERMTKLTFDNQSLLEKIGSVEQEKSMHRHSTQHLELQYTDVYNRITELQLELQLKQKENDELKGRISQHTIELTQARSNQLQIKQQAGSNELELQKLIKINSRLESENIKLTSELKVTETERDDLQAKLDESKGQSNQITNDLQRQIRQQQQEIEKLTRQLTDLQRITNEHKEREVRRQNEITDLNNQIDDLTKTVAHLNSDLANLDNIKEENRAKEKKIITWQSQWEIERKRYLSEIDSLKNELNQGQARLSTERQSLTKDLEQNQKEVHGLRQEASTLKFENEQLQKQLKVEQQTLKELKQREGQNLKDDLEAQKRTSQQLLEQQRQFNEDAIKRLKQDYERRVQELESKATTSKQLLQQNSELEVQHLKLQIHSLEDRLKGKDGEIMELLEQIQTLQKQNRDKQTQMLEMSQQLDRAKLDHQKAQSQLQFHEDERNSLTLKLERVTSEIREISKLEEMDELRRVKLQYVQLQSEFQQLHDKHQQCIVGLARDSTKKPESVPMNIQKEISSRDAEIHNLRNQLASTRQSEKSDKRPDIPRTSEPRQSVEDRQNKQTIETIQREFKLVLEEKTRLEARVSQLTQSNQTLVQQMERLRSDSQVDQYLTKIADLEGDIEVLIQDSKQQLMEREELIIKITELEKITRVSERSRDSSKGRNNEHEINIKLMAEIKVLNQKLHKYEQVIADLENQLGEQHHKEEELNRKIDGLLHSRRNTSPERGDLALKVIQLEQELNQARLMTNRDTSRTQLEQQLNEQNEEIEILIDQVKKQDKENKDLLVELSGYRRQVNDYAKEVSFMKDLLNDSTQKSRHESSTKEVEDLRSYIIQLENKCALLALDHAASSRYRDGSKERGGNQERSSVSHLQREVDEWKNRATKLQTELDSITTPDLRYWRSEHSQTLTVSTRQQLGLGISQVSAI